VSWAVDSVVSGRESMMVSGGCLLVGINQLPSDGRCAVSYVVMETLARSGVEEM
jgi:hypothetical protein